MVGLVQDGKYTANLAEAPQPAMFFPLLQVPSSETWLVIRSPRDAEELSAAVRATLRAFDPGLPASIETWTRDMSSALFPRGVAAAALGILGAMGAIVAITGIFGTAAYSLSKHLKDLGIRVALGAGGLDVIQRRSAARCACSRWARWRAWSSGSSRAACSDRSCTKPHRVIRWCWSRPSSRCSSWASSRRGFLRGARSRSIPRCSCGNNERVQALLRRPK